jgi:ATP-dependent DNA helicase RecG
MSALDDLGTILRRLDGLPADALESETLEFKQWNPEPAAKSSQLREVRENVVCLANSQGGLLVIGVADRKRTRREAIQGVPNLSTDELRKAVYDGTEPHILVEVDERVEPEGRILVVRVPRGMPPHSTSEGVTKIRVGKECKPLTGSQLARLLMTRPGQDLTAEPAPNASGSDLDPAQIEALRRTVAAESATPELARLPQVAFLETLGLTRGHDISLAGIILLGRASAIARWAAWHEVVFLRFRSRTKYDVRHDLKGPLLAVLDSLKQLLEAHVRIETIEAGGFTERTVPAVSWWVVREAVLNALVHRDYFLREPIQVELHPSRLEVTSPGGFIGGVTPENILRHPPVRRNPLLATVLQTAGLVNRAGVGVDRIFDDLLRLGKAPPRYSGDESHVRLSISTATQPAFARFVADETRSNRLLDLDDLLLLRAVADRGVLDRWAAAERLQLGEDDAAGHLARLRERGYLVVQGRGRGASYRLKRDLSNLLRGQAATEGDEPFDHASVRLQVEALLHQRGRLSNAEVRAISGFTRAEVTRLMKQLVDAGKAQLQGERRGAHYVPGSALLRKK